MYAYAISQHYSAKPSQEQIYQESKEGHLGKVSATCLNYAKSKDKIKNSENQQTAKLIDQNHVKITTLKQANSNIHNQYDSTLLEKIAGQPREQSINQVGAEKAKQDLEQNNRKISTLEKEVSHLKNELAAKPESVSFLSFIKDDGKFKTVEKGYQQASFWYPSFQLAFQSLFLV